MKPDQLEIEPLLNAKDVSKILRCSVPHVYKMANRRQLPCVRWDCPCEGNKRSKTVIRFKKSDILKFLEDNHEN
jgi:hypothetical protein